MILGCALWLGRGKPIQYLTSITSFIVQNSSEGIKVSLFYSKNKFNLPENFEDLYQEFQQQHESMLPQYEELIKRIDFCDIDTDFENDKYVAWLEQFEPTPYAFISDYLRFAALFKLATNLERGKDLIAFFELDVEFKSPLPDDVAVDTVTLPELESALYLILVNQPQCNAIILLARIVRTYTELYQKVLCHMDVEKNPNSLDILENEGFITRTLGIDLDLPEETPDTTSALSAGHVNLRGFYKVVQGLALEVMRDWDDEMGPGEYLSTIDVAEFVEHFPSSIESVYKNDAYKIKRATTIHALEDVSASNTEVQKAPKIMRPSRSAFFDEPPQVSKRMKTTESNCTAEVKEEGPPF